MDSISGENMESIFKLVQDRLMDKYDAIFIANLDKDEILTVRASRSTSFGKFEGRTVPYSRLLTGFAEFISEEYRKDWLNFCNPLLMQQFIGQEDHREFVFEMPGVAKALHRAAVEVLERKEGKASVVLFSFVAIDDMSAKAILYQKEIAKQKEQLEVQKKQLEEALDMAQSASRAKTTFLNSMSHDIRTPMNAIIGYTRLASSHAADRIQVAGYLNKIEKASDHLLSLINDVLDMSRIESGNMNLSENPENIHEIVHNIQDIVQQEVQAKQLDFHAEAINLKDEFVYCDKLRLNQVLINVISNAIKYTPSGGMLSISVKELSKDSPDHATYEFRCKDSGMGMSREFLKTIYDPFTRVKSSTVSGIQGTGLGMSITKRIVDMMGGTIDIESELGKGTQVTVTLSLKLQDAATIESNARKDMTDDDSEFDISGKKILLVEDNELNMEIATAVLEEFGCIITQAQDGQIGVEKMKKARYGDYDMVLMDVQMPTIDGYEATRQIRALGTSISRIPIIAMTANAFEEDRKAAVEAGMNDHIAKPIDISKLKEVLAHYLN